MKTRDDIIKAQQLLWKIESLEMLLPNIHPAKETHASLHGELVVMDKAIAHRTGMPNLETEGFDMRAIAAAVQMEVTRQAYEKLEQAKQELRELGVEA